MSKTSGEWTPIVGCRQFGGCQARYRTPATNWPFVPVGCSGTRCPLQVTTCRESTIPFTSTCILSTRRIDIARRRRPERAPHPVRSTARSPGAIPVRCRDVRWSRNEGSEIRNAARTIRVLERIACFIQFVDDIFHILADEMRQHETVVNLGAPSHQILRGRAASRIARSVSAAAGAA